MKTVKFLFPYFVILACLWSCKEDRPKIIKDQDPVNTNYEQYRSPFAAVPEIDDIIMYEVNLRAFSQDGDLQGVIDRLDHIQSLGVNVLWLMPIHPIGELNSVNSPYSVRDHKAVSSEYGNLTDLRNLTDQAHARGMAVILDWVANHTAWDNAWITNKDWYTQDGAGNIIHPPGTNWQDVADLNFSNTDMRAAMVDAMLYWIYEANIDGFRCDYADGVPFDFWQNTWQALDTIQNREFILFAEGARSNHFSAGFDLNFGWESYDAVKDVFNGQSASKLFTANSNEYNVAGPNQHWVRFTTNHDESAWDATPISLFNGVDGALAASVATIFIGGVPLIYSSQEVGTSGNVPFFWNSTINWSGNPEMLDSYKKILNFYYSSDEAKQGALTYYPHNDIVSFTKDLGDNELCVLVNVRNSTKTYSLPEVLSGSWTNQMNLESITLDTEIELEPYEFLILTSN